MRGQRYERLDRLGGGVDTAVHRAVERGSAGRIVALKSVRPDAPPAATARLQHEGELLQRVTHPHLIGPVEVTGEGIVMPYHARGDLTVRLAAGPLPLPEATAIVAGTGGALAALHAAGVVHRDVAPTNILLTADNRPVLIDLGAAVSRDRPATVGMVVGTAAYLAPEVAGGAAASPTSDLYALAVVAYELFAGAPPFQGATDLATLRAADHGGHVPLVEAAPQLPAAIAVVVEHAMARDPERRPASVGAFVDALTAAVAAAPLASPGEAPGPSSTEPRRRAGRGGRGTPRSAPGPGTPLASPGEAPGPSSTEPRRRAGRGGRGAPPPTPGPRTEVPDVPAAGAAASFRAGGLGSHTDPVAAPTVIAAAVPGRPLTHRYGNAPAPGEAPVAPRRPRRTTIALIAVALYAFPTGVACAVTVTAEAPPQATTCQTDCPRVAGR